MLDLSEPLHASLPTNDALFILSHYRQSIYGS